MSWLDRLRGGFAKTADRVADNLTGLTTKAALDTFTGMKATEMKLAAELDREALLGHYARIY